MAGQDSRVGDRQATSMRIKLKYPDVETFIQKYAVNISRGGIFIATKQPKPVGTFVKFEFLLSNAESQSIIRGEGQVQWTKEFDAAYPARAHGMGVKFIRLDAESQGVVDRALRWRAEHGTSPNAQVPTGSTTSSAHATVTLREGSQSRRLPSQDLADSEDATTRRRQAERDDLADADEAPTGVRDPSQADKLPQQDADAAPERTQVSHREEASRRDEANRRDGMTGNPEEATGWHTAAEGQQDVTLPHEEAMNRRNQAALPSVAAPAPVESAAPPLLLGRRDETRPIAIQHDEDDGRGRAPHDETRPIPLSGSAAVRARGGDEIDALASEWGLSEEKLARSLKRARPRMAEATAELERLLLKPPRPPAPSKAEAMTQLAALLAKRSVKGAREGNGAREGSGNNGVLDKGAHDNGVQATGADEGAKHAEGAGADASASESALDRLQRAR